MKKRAISLALILLMLTALFPAALAVDDVSTTRDPPETETIEITADGEVFLPDPDSLPDSDELFAAYVQQEFEREIYGGISTFGTAAGDRLSGLEKDIYTDLKTKITEVATGARSSTVFDVSADFSSLKWTKAELGVSAIVSGGSVTDEAQTAVNKAFSQAVDLEKILNCLLADCPYELYWFNKTSGMAVQRGTSYSSTSVSITGLTLSFMVASAYASGTYTANTTKTGATSTAVTNAKAIVTANASKADREKLEAYRAKICELVSYNSSAAGGSTAYGDPWQLIYVFDGDSSTNVVCEGYAKAFQYLCDLSTFSGDVTCYTVTGTMSGGTGAGGHMWNVVQLENKNLLVDVTNCDSGTIGATTKLFLVAVAGTDSGRTHTFTINTTNVVYTYDESQKDLFCSGYLALTPDSSSGTGTIQLKVTSYGTAASTVVGLYQNGALKKSTMKPGTQTGQLTSNVITVTNVTPGVYDLVVSKSGCLDYTIKNVVVTSDGVDLTSHSDPAVKNITLLAGDVDGDGNINESDVSVIRYASNINKTASSAANPLADVDGDGNVNESDVSIVRYAAHINKSKTHCTYNY